MLGEAQCFPRVFFREGNMGLITLKRDYIVNDPRKGKVLLKKGSVINSDTFPELQKQEPSAGKMQDKMVRSSGEKNGR